MNTQLTLTVAEAKWLIARGVATIPCVRKALATGRIFLKGGTTVSAVSEVLVGEPMRISGRIAPAGAKTAQSSDTGFHSALIEKGEFIGVDDCLEETVAKMTGADVVIIGANAFDAYGNAALMYGAELGGPPGRIISGLMSEFEHVIIPVGWEKFLPGSLPEIVTRIGRRGIDRAMGMAVGLTPLIGRIVTETDAAALLAKVACTLIGKGGIDGAEGATTFVASGEPKEVQKLFEIVLSVKGKGTSGCLPSLECCEPPHEKCKVHRACIYRKGAGALRKKRLKTGGRPAV